jgi:hypothetical protein
MDQANYRANCTGISPLLPLRRQLFFCLPAANPLNKPDLETEEKLRCQVV